MRKKYPESESEYINLTKGTPDDLIRDFDWSARPYEINAQARQIQHTLAKVRKQKPGKYNTEDIERLEELVKNTLPFVDDFTKKYPKESGNYILEGANFLDNMKHVQW